MPCRNWIEQGFRGLKTVGDPLGGKWHKTRRLDPGALWARVGRHWLVLALATLLAVAYGTRHEEAAARHLAPGRLRRPPAELGPAPRIALPPRRHSLLQQGVALLRHLLLRGYLWACVGLRQRLAPTSARACARCTPAAPEPTRALGAGPASHSSIALPPRPGRLGPLHSAARPTGTSAPRAFLPLHCR